MNIFYLHEDPNTCAQMHCDKHVVKMILEYAQLMSTAHHMLDEEQAIPGLYKCTHKNHPSAVWTREAPAHYKYVLNLFNALAHEYKHRYKKNHLTFTKLTGIIDVLPRNMSDSSEFVDPPQCMPDVYKQESTVGAYRAYYKLGKEQTWIRKFTDRQIPSWL